MSNESDFWLVDALRQRLAEPAHGPRLFVLHTMGSHPDACKRIEDIDNPFTSSEPRYDYLACYLTSIAKMDTLMKRLTHLLQASPRAFSILYFSDHGMVHTIKKNGRMELDNRTASKRHYDVPLVKIDSDVHEARYDVARKSGLRFTEGLAHWLGIANPLLKDYDLFDGVDDPQDFGLSERIAAIPEPLDPAIDVSKWVHKAR